MSYFQINQDKCTFPEDKASGLVAIAVSVFLFFTL